MGFSRFWMPVAIVASGLVALATPAAASLRYEEVDEDYVIGQLTWNNGQGGISWDAEAPTEDKTPGGAYAEFRSQPVRETMFLNASRLIQLDFGAFACAWEYVLIEVDGNLLAGSTGFPSDMIAGVHGPPAGWCFYRMQPELDVIPKDAIVRVAISYHPSSCLGPCNPNSGSPLTMKGTLRAELRIPIFSSTDAVLRVAQLADARKDPTPPVGPPEIAQEVVEAVDGVLTSLLGFAGFLTIPLGRRRTSVAAVVLVTALLALSGCVGGHKQPAAAETPEPTGGSIKSTKIAGGNGTPDGVGSIVGFVHGERRTPVGGATVWLVGYQFVRTDVAGKFALENIVARTYTLRVNATGYLVLESQITVTAGDVQRVEIELEPVVKKAGDASWHPHDYWGSRSVVTVFDDDLVMGAGSLTGENTCGRFGVEGSYFLLATCAIYSVSIPALDGNDDLVKPGTSDVEVAVSWDGGVQNTATVAIVSFIGNNEHSWFNGPNLQPANRTYMVPKANGVSTHIRTGWEMADFGHQQFSTWVFSVQIPHDNTYTLDQTFHMTIKVHRGVVPLEPGHRDLWHGLNTSSVLEKSMMSGSKAVRPTGAGSVPQGVEVNNIQAKWAPVNLTPPETLWLDGNLKISGGPDDSIQWKLYAKTANSPPSEWSQSNPNYHAIDLSPVTGGFSFRHALADDEPDPFYAQKTGWVFFLDDGQDMPLSPTRPGETGFTFELTVVAHRDPMPAG